MGETVLKEWSNRHRAILLLLPIALSIALRLYPYFFYGVPWGTDGWPLIKDSNELLQNSPTSLGRNSVFDSYNIYWPGASLFGSVSSLVLGSSPIATMPVIVPLAAALSTFVLFVLILKLTRNNYLAASIASLLFTTASFDSIFTASVTKETFAYPLFMTAILLIFLIFLRNASTAKNLGIFALISFALVSSHHAMSFILLTISSFVALSQIILRISRNQQLGVVRTLAAPSVVGVIFVLYFVLYVPQGALPVSITYMDFVTAGSFLVLTFALGMYFVLSKQVKQLLPIGVILISCAFGVVAISTFTSFVPFAPVISSVIAIYTLPYLFVGLFSLAGYRFLHDFDKDSFAFVAVWLAAPVALVAYAVFGTPNGLGLVYRGFTFVYAPVAVLGAVGLIGIFLPKKKESTLSFKRLRNIGLISIVALVVLLGVYESYAGVVQNQNLLGGGNWAYHRSDYQSAEWAKLGVTSSSSNITSFEGDTKISYLFSGYFGLTINVRGGFETLTSNIGTPPQAPLVTYSLMGKDGYNLFLYGEQIPQNWEATLQSHASLVYSNGNDQIWG